MKKVERRLTGEEKRSLKKPDVLKRDNTISGFPSCSHGSDFPAFRELAVRLAGGKKSILTYDSVTAMKTL